ncbi:MAG TPA: CDP-alcohol phosphatidyltransferase family protein [Thermoleophilia bacterium]|nr:CDP-alcohol phosphatidyltransferase family protein [Thermoleophilia bacterium]
MAGIKTAYTNGARRGFYRLGVVLSHMGVSANMLTAAGLALSVVAGWLIVEGHFFWTAVAFGVAAACDGMDGAVARAGRGPTRSGAFLDSTLDRISEIIVFGALAYAMADAGRMWEFVATLVCLGSALMVSYTRARAEALGTDCTVGFMSRPERLVALLVGFAFAGFEPFGVSVLTLMLLAIAVLTPLTVVRRLTYVMSRLRAAEREQSSST